MTRPRKATLDTKIIHSLDKGLVVLEMVAESGGEASLSDLAQQLKWDKSTVFRLLTTLVRRGYLDREDDTKRYRLGFRILYLEQQLFRSLDLARLSRDILASLASSTSEAAHLAVLQRNQVVIVAQEESRERVAANAHVGTSEPLHCTALGKAVLMQLPDEALRQVIAQLELTSYTQKTITSSEWLFKHVEKVRGAGYALDEEEFDPEVRCIAAPVPIPSSRQLFALGISGPSSRISGGRMQTLVEHVLKAAATLSARFGGAITTRRTKSR